MWKEPAFYASAFLILVALASAIYFFRKPLRMLFRFLIRSLIWAGVLILMNTVAGSHGWYMGVNPVTAGVLGLLGLPGLGGLYLLKWLLI